MVQERSLDNDRSLVCSSGDNRDRIVFGIGFRIGLGLVLLVGISVQVLDLEQSPDRLVGIGRCFWDRILIFSLGDARSLHMIYGLA